MLVTKGERDMLLKKYTLDKRQTDRLEQIVWDEAKREAYRAMRLEAGHD